MKENRIIFICGPTGVGKSELAIKLALKLNTEIISCDSMQIFKEMNIGTAKISSDENKLVTHHMIDIINPDQSFSVYEYQQEAKNIINAMHQKGKIPIIVGGTGLYINSLYYDYKFNHIPPNYEIRNKLEKEFEMNPELFLTSVKEISPLFSKLNIRDKKKLIRAKEVYLLTGTIMENKPSINNDYQSYLYVITDDRDILYNKINARVDYMIESGLIKEVKYLLNKYRLTSDMQSMKAIGYRELIPYLDGVYNYETMIEILKKDSRHYAKRQLTWFRKIKEAVWLDKSLMTDKFIFNHIIGEIGADNEL